MAKENKSNETRNTSNIAKIKWGAELGVLIKFYFDNPPYQSTYLKKLPCWTPKTFAAAVGFSDAAVRQWLRGDELPVLGMPRIIDALFGPDPERFKSEKEELWSLLRRCKDLRAQGNAAQNEPARPSQIPSLTPYFLGRDDECIGIVEAITTNVQSSRTILVQGGPGMGKTELTKAVVHDPRVAAHFGERRWFVRFENATTADAMKNAILRELGCDLQSGFQAALSYLGSARSLLVLDNLETPWETISERTHVENVLGSLSAMPGVSLLASFRGNEMVGGTRWVQHQVSALSPKIARELFGSIAGVWVYDDADLAKFIEALGGVPLAIELIARRARGRISLASLWAEWLRIGADLANRPDFQATAITSLPHSIELSLQSVRIRAHPALRLFSFLGHAPSGLDAEDCSALLGTDAFEAQERLVQVGLGIERQGRIDLLPPIREHARRHRPPNGADDDAWVDHFCEIARRLGVASASENAVDAVRSFDTAFRNIESALFALLDRARLAALKNQIENVAWLTVLTANSTELFELASKVYQDSGDYVGQAMSVKAKADVALGRSDIETAKISYQRAREVYQLSQETAGVAQCTGKIGDIFYLQSEFDAAQEAYDEAATLFERLHDMRGQANNTKAIGNISYVRGDFEKAALSYQSAAEFYAKVNDHRGRANCLCRLGNIAIQLEEHDAADSFFAEAKSLHQKCGDALGEANDLKGLGTVALQRGLYEQSSELFLKAIDIYVSALEIIGEANCRYMLAEVEFLRGEIDVAKPMYDYAEDLYVKQKNKLGEANCKQRLGEIAARRGNYNEAAASLHAAVDIYKSIGAETTVSQCEAKLENI